MEITNDLVKRLAELSKLEFNESELVTVKDDLQKMLNFIDKLQEVDTHGVQPLIFMTDEVNKLRADESISSITQQEALKNAPDKDSDYFRVPKVLKK